MITFERTIISQYSNAPILNQLIANLNDYIDPRINIQLFTNNLWNVLSAVGYGLDVWGRIVGVTRVVQIPTSPLFFGFLEALPFGAVGFGQGPFWNGTEALTQPYDLDDDQFRTLILAKALANICDGSIRMTNQILLGLFPGRGNCYVVDGENMTLTYRFSFSLTQVEYAIVTQSGVLPKPAGVLASVVMT